jgi:DNA polymerase-3 subunit delta
VSIRQWRQELEKGLAAPAYLLASADPFLLYEALTGLRGRFRDQGDFGFEVLDLASPDERPSVDRILDVLNTLPFLAERKTVVVRNIQKWPKADARAFAEYLKAPSPSTLLVMLCEGNVSDVFTGPDAKLLKTLLLAVTERELPAWIRQKAAERGVAFSDRAVDCLITMAGTDLGMLCAEIEKFSATETGKTIDAEEVKAIVYAGAEYNGFDLVDALKRRDAKSVFRIYEQLGRSVEGPMLLGALNWQYTGGASRGRQDKAQTAAITKLLHEADRGLKTSRSHVMEELLVKLLKL